MKGKVYLMGAGSGDPDLLSAQAVRVLRAAEVVLHDDPVSPEILEFVPASAQVRNVHKLGLQAGSLQEKIQSLLISAARDGHYVVRLKSGDEQGLNFLDRKSTRLNSSHPSISYAVFCLKK